MKLQVISVRQALLGHQLIEQPVRLGLVKKKILKKFCRNKERISQCLYGRKKTRSGSNTHLNVTIFRYQEIKCHTQIRLKRFSLTFD